MKKLMKMTLRTQITLSMILLTLIATITVALSSWNICKNKMEYNYKVANETNLQIFNDIISDKMKDLNELVRAVFLSKDFQAIIETENVSGSSNYTSAQRHLFWKFFRELESQNELIKGVAIFDKEGRYTFWYRNAFSTGEYRDYYYGKNAEQEDWYQEAVAKKGREVYYNYNVLADDHNDSIVSMVKELRDPASRQSIALAVVLLSDDFLNSTFLGTGKDFNSEVLMVVDDKHAGFDVWSTSSGDDYKEAYETYLSGNAKGKLIITEKKNEISGWTLVHTIDAEELSRESTYLRTLMVLISVLIIAICLLITHFLSRQIYLPLGKLESIILKIQEGSRNITEEFDDSEIGKIGNTLKNTVNNNIELQERILRLQLKEKESELQLLQAQINPHFLYNTLDSIYCKAELEEQQEIADMVEALSDLFKISLSKGQRIIQIKEELRYIEQYVKIQNLRYKNRFELILEVDEELLELYIIKLILEPFVENAITHGLETRLGGGYVEMKGEILGDEIYFTVTDNGIGMKDPDDIYSGYGVRNVIERIHLYYGEEYGVQVTSKPNVGTEVQIHVPRLDNEEAGLADIYS